MSKIAIMAGWDDVPHLDEKAKLELAASYMPHERDARTKGIPSLGAGAIYPVPESDFVIDPFELPAWYEFAYGLDVGWNRTAAIWGARDTATDVVYLWAEHYRSMAEPPVHAEAIRSKGRWIPGVCDPAARGRSQHDGEQLLMIYRNLGLDPLTVADNAVDSGLYAVWIRLSTGRLKVFRSLSNWLAEFRLYRREEGKEGRSHIVKEFDHAMDATRYLIMSGLSVAAQTPVEVFAASRGKRHVADYDPYADSFQVR